MKTQQRSLWNRFWYDSDGKLSLAEWPNIPLIGAALFFLFTRIPFSNNLHVATQYIYFGFLFTWAWLEITKGKSYFRRLLGVTILLYIIYSHMN